MVNLTAMPSIEEIRKNHRIESIEIMPDMKTAFVHVAYSIHCPKGCGNSDYLGNSIFSTTEIRDCRCYDCGDWKVRRAFRVSVKDVKGLL